MNEMYSFVLTEEHQLYIQYLVTCTVTAHHTEQDGSIARFG